MVRVGVTEAARLSRHFKQEKVEPASEALLGLTCASARDQRVSQLS